MNPVVRLIVMFGGWLVWVLPFFLFRPAKSQAVTLKPAARWGIALQTIAFFMTYMHSPATWNLPFEAWRLAAGVIPWAVAVTLAWQGIRTLGRQWRIDAGLNADHELVRVGPYRLIRHPIYASMLCMLLCGIAWCGTLPLWPVVLVLGITGIEIRVRVEDGLLHERFGAEFTEWRRAVPAYLPFIR